MAEELPSKMRGLIKKEEKESYLLEDMDVPEPQGDEVTIPEFLNIMLQ